MEKEREKGNELKTVLDDISAAFGQVLGKDRAKLRFREIGKIVSVGRGIARIRGLPAIRYEELIRFPGSRFGIAFNLDPDEVAAVLLEESKDIKAGQEVRRTGRVMDAPVGEELLGRVVDATGRPLDELGPVRTVERWPIERIAPPIMDRAPVSVPLQTGIKVIDALIPIGRGQRELILGDRQTGKTAIALDTIINQTDKDVLCIYCSIGKRKSAVARVVDDLKRYGAIKNCIVVVATGEETPGLNFITPYAATTMAEYFMEQGRDALVVYDDLTRHAWAYRELSLLLRRPPAREAYPGDIFYIHSRLLERSTRLRKGGSLTAIPIIETQAENISAYIPTNLISITDGQIYLSPRLFQEGVLPAVDVGESVSRVGGKTQLPAYREVAGDLRLSYSQFEELESFARFGTRLEEETRKTLERGRRVREVLKQPQYRPVPVPGQIGVLLAVTGGIFDGLPPDKVAEAENKIRKVFPEKLPELYRSLQDGRELSDSDKKALLDMAGNALHSKGGEGGAT